MLVNPKKDLEYKTSQKQFQKFLRNTRGVILKGGGRLNLTITPDRFWHCAKIKGFSGMQHVGVYQNNVYCLYSSCLPAHFFFDTITWQKNMFFCFQSQELVHFLQSYRVVYCRQPPGLCGKQKTTHFFFNSYFVFTFYLLVVWKTACVFFGKKTSILFKLSNLEFWMRLVGRLL